MTSGKIVEQLDDMIHWNPIKILNFINLLFLYIGKPFQCLVLEFFYENWLHKENFSSIRMKMWKWVCRHHSLYF